MLFHLLCCCIFYVGCNQTKTNFVGYCYMMTFVPSLTFIAQQTTLFFCIGKQFTYSHQKIKLRPKTTKLSSYEANYNLFSLHIMSDGSYYGTILPWNSSLEQYISILHCDPNETCKCWVYHLLISMRFVLPDRDQLSSADLKKPSVQEKKKPILLRELENELRHLDEIDDDDFGSVQDPYLHDGVLDRLQMIAKEAVKHDLKEIEKLCKLAIGKRILNIELKKKKDEHYSKLRKKQKIELFFRQNRIKRYNYDSLMEQKLKDNALVAKAYQNGKGFIESVACYQQDHEKALAQCEFLTTIKEVNRIFYNNYSSLHRGVADSGTDTILRLVWIPIAVFVCLAISLPFASFLWQQLVLMGLLAIILVMLLCVSVKTFLDKPNSNNQIEQTMEDVQAYFETLNQRHLHRGSSIEWNCSKDFMYLEVVFHNGLPT